MNHRATRNRRETVLAMAGLALVLFLVSLDGTVVGTAMPRIVAELNGFELYAWVTLAYLVAQTAVIPLVGKLGDMFGRKWLAVGGVALFVGASALCGLAGSMFWLIVCRGLQGLGGGILFSSVFALIADIYPDATERARYQGTLFTVFSFSSLFGPVLGGWITDAIGWRWVFYVNLPPGLLALAVLPFVLPQGERRAGARIDVAGALLSVVATVALLLALEVAGTGAAWTSPPVLGGLLVAALALAAFVPVELRAQEPIIPLTLFRDRTLSAGVLVGFMTGVVLLGVSLYTPLFAQAVRGLSASASGVLMMPMVVAMPLIAMLVGPVIARVGRLKPFLLIGGLVMTLAAVPLLTADAGTDLFLLGGLLFLMAVGLGLVLPATPLAVQSTVAPQHIGVATAAMAFLQSMGATIGGAIIGMLVTSGYHADLAARAPAGLPAAALAALQNPNALIDPTALQQLGTILAGTPAGAAATPLLLGIARVALAGAIREGFVVVLISSVLVLAGAFVMADLRLGANVAPDPASDEPAAAKAPATPGAPGAAHGAAHGMPASGHSAPHAPAASIARSFKPADCADV